MSLTPEPIEPTIRSLAIAVYLPIVLFAIGEGAVVPFIVVGAENLGASASTAGIVFALHGLGSVAFALPAGALIARVGSRTAAIVAVVTTVVALAVLIVSDSIAVYAAAIFIIGVGWAIWRLVRFDFLAGAIARERRGRALSVMGGSQRIGRFLGPMLAFVLIGAYGLDSVFSLHILAAVVAIAVFVSVPLTDSERPPRPERLTYRALAREHRQSFGTAGIGFLFLVVLRSARPVVLPLWALHIGLDEAAIGLIFGVSTAIDAGAFYPAGLLMDRLGRKWAAMISMLTLVISFLAVPLADSFASLLLVGLVMGFGNGIGSGYGATLGSDLAPVDARAEFLGLWQMMANVGTISGPLLIGGLVAIASIGFASVTIGVIGVLGATHIAARVPETLEVADT